MKNNFLNMLTTALAVAAASATPAQALTTCQNDCNSQYYATVNTLWQAPRPATTAPATYQQQVMAALNTLNQCLAACATSATEAPPATSAPATPSSPKGKK